MTKFERVYHRVITRDDGSQDGIAGWASECRVCITPILIVETIGGPDGKAPNLSGFCSYCRNSFKRRDKKIKAKTNQNLGVRL
jgi:hypothetical protein